MSGPDRPGGWAEQSSRQGLCLEEGGGRGVVRAVCECAAQSGGCCHCCQMSGYDLGGQGLALPLLSQRQLYLEEEEKDQIVCEEESW